MTDARMLIIVPTRSRPENVAKVVRAWEDTDAFSHASLIFVFDDDDPRRVEYAKALQSVGVIGWLAPKWEPLVPKLNTVAKSFASTDWFAIGFAGDDHLPRTHGWAARYLEALIEMGTGIVSCADPGSFRNDDLPAQWAMTADIVRALGRMVPAPVEHLYCDDAIRDLAKAAGCWRYLDDVLIEHMHPLSGKSKWDDQYRYVNREEQYAQDGAAYSRWKERGDLYRDAAKVRDLLTSK